MIAIDSGVEKQRMLAKYGVQDFIDFKNFSTEDALVEEVKRVSGGRGPHVSPFANVREPKKGTRLTFCRPKASVVFSSGATAYNTALKYLRPRGTLVCVGLPAVSSGTRSRHEALEKLIARPGQNATLQAEIYTTVCTGLRIVGSSLLTFIAYDRQNIVLIQTCPGQTSGTVKTRSRLSTLPREGRSSPRSALSLSRIFTAVRRAFVPKQKKI